MMKIIYHEMRKGWLKIITILVLVIFTALNCVCMNDSCRTDYLMTYGSNGDAYFKLYQTVCGELDEEKIAPFRYRAMELKNEVMDLAFSHEYQPDKYYTGYIFGDFNLYNNDIGPEITYCATYSNLSEAITAEAVACYSFYKSVGNDFEAEKNALIYHMYQDRHIDEYRATYWTKLFFQYDFSSLLCIIMLILGLSASFSTEKESGMLQLIISSGNINKTISAKIASSAIYCAFLSIYFTICDLILTHVFLGIDGLNMPVYSAQLFKNSPFTFNFGEAIFIWVGVRFLALFLLSLIMLLVSKIAHSTIVSICICFGISLLLMLLTAISDSIFNPICALIPNAYIAEFSVVNIFGKPVVALYAATIVLIIECIAVGIMLFYDKQILTRCKV